MHWTTVNGAPAGSTVTLTSAITGDAAVDNYIYSYTTKANRPSSVVMGTRKNSSGTETRVEVINKDQYISLSDKGTDGQVNQIWPKQEVNSYKLYVWPETDTATDYLVLWVQRTLEDFDASTDTPDFPQEWYLPLVYNLAVLLFPKYGTPLSVADRIAAMAVTQKEIAMGFGQDDSVFFSPDFQGMR